MRTFDLIESQSNRIGKYLAIIAGLATFFMMIVVAADVGLMALKLGSLSIAVGLVEMLMIVTVFGAIAYTDVLDRHVIANMVTSRFSERWQALTGIFSNTVSLAICIIFTWQVFVYAVDMTRIQKTCLSSSLLYYPFTWFAVAGFFLLDIRFVIRIARCIESVAKGGKNAGA
jgi:TRAP-type C4-dicarboxylate transport system permease small subunit